MTPDPESARAFAPHDHARCQARILDQAEARLKAQGARMTPVRRRTLEILLEAHRALGAYEVLDRLARDGFGKQPPVVYRALDFLVRHGLAHRLQRLNAFAACTDPAQDHAPAFLICRACDRVAETSASALRGDLMRLAQRHGFTVERTTIEALGLCPACAETAPA